jgi:catalase
MNLSICKKDIQDKMIQHFINADPEYGRRVAEGLKMHKHMKMKMGAEKNDMKMKEPEMQMK